MQHLNVWPFGYQPCPDLPVNERCVCQKKRISGEIKWLKMHPVTSAYSPIAQPLKKVFRLHIFSFITLFGLTFSKVLYLSRVAVLKKGGERRRAG